MNTDERIRFLLQAASRAEHEGEPRIAHTLRRMADEARPIAPGPIDAGIRYGSAA